jgi:phage/plasmid-like protein (TIGR03299 family)
MSANISVNSNGQHEVMVVGEPAWHKLGVNVKTAKTWEQASKLASLTWTISKKQFANPITGKPVPSYALLRDDDHRYLATVGDKYFPIQNKDAFNFVDAVIGTGEAHYESAGALGNGETMWCLAKLNNDFSPVKGDKHYPYLLFSEFRDGRAAIVKMCIERVVCNNTLNVALKEDCGTVLKLRHTSSVKEKMELAKSLIKGVNGQLLSINDKLKKLVEKKVTQPQFEKIMEALFPGWEKQGRSQNKAAIVASNFMSNDGDKISGIKGSAYSLLQSVTRYIDHQRDGLRVDGKPELLEVKRAESAMFGNGEQFKNEALNTICEVVQLAPPSIDRIASMMDLKVPSAA